MNANRTKHVARVAVIAVLVFAVGALAIDRVWSRFDHWLFRIGLTSPISVSDVEISMQDSWYLSMSSQKGFGRLILNSPRPTAIARKLPRSNMDVELVIAISKLGDQEAKKMMSPGAHISETKIFPWGTAVILVGNRAAFVPEYSIVISDDATPESHLLQVLEDIRYIRTLQ